MFISLLTGSLATFVFALCLSVFISYLSRHSMKRRTASTKTLDKPNTTLPNGLKMYTNGSWIDIKCVYREIFEWETYCSENSADQFIKLDKDNPTVFDIGSNVGMFAVYLARRFPKIRLHCFEPLPETYALCEKNLRLHAGDRLDKSIFCHKVALSDRNGEETFVFNPFLTMVAAASSQHEAMHALGKKHGLLPWLHAFFVDTVGLVESPLLQSLLKKLAKLTANRYGGPLVVTLMLPYLLYFVVSSLIHSYFFDERVACKLNTLPTFLSQHASDIEKIDLVKLDVEGSEMDVLNGIDDTVWPKIQQMTIEVHDVNGRVEKMKQLLIEKGFEIKVTQEDWESHKLLDIHAIFARRPKKL